MSWSFWLRQKADDMAQSPDAGPWCSWPNTPPCHGGDRRFESGRARQEAYALQNTTFMVVFFDVRVFRIQRTSRNFNSTFATPSRNYTGVGWMGRRRRQTKILSTSRSGCPYY